MEMNSMMMQLLNQKTIDFQSMVNKSKFQQLNQQDKEKQRDKIIQQQLKKTQANQTKIDLFNSYYRKIAQNSKFGFLLQMALRLFSGSRDIPKDFHKAKQFLKVAEKNALTEEEKNDLYYFTYLIERLEAKQIGEQDKYIELNQKMYELAQNGHIKAQFTYGKQLFNAILFSQFTSSQARFEYQSITYQQQKITNYLNYCISINNAAKHGLNAAFFFLGKMHSNPSLFQSIEYNPQLAFQFFLSGAAKDNAYCYYELSQIYNKRTNYQSDLNIEKSDYLYYNYMKKSAEEGFVYAQQKLGQIYYEGEIVQKDDKLALAWFREAIKNGYYYSYVDAGEILTRGGNNIKPNLLFGFAHFLRAYSMGAIYLEPRMKELEVQLSKLGHVIPKIVYTNHKD